MKKIICTLLMASCAIAFTWAIPAYPELMTITQPDGTEINIYLRGDEFFHYTTSEDGYLLQRNTAGIFEYATLSENKIKPIGVKAHSVKERTAEEKAALTTLQKNVITHKYMQERRQTSVMKVAPQFASKTNSNLPARGLVILANFLDKKFNEGNTQEAMNEMLNGDNYTYKNGANGSVKKYFSDQSIGTYVPQFDVVGPVQLPKSMAYYGTNVDKNDKLPGDLIVHACSLAHSNYNVDFSLYDNDNDNYVDFVFVIYAGYSEAAGAPETTIWPHRWNIYSAITSGKCSMTREETIFNGKKIGDYACGSELRGKTGTNRDGIGTICHEFSHLLGLSDYYDTSSGDNYQKTLNNWNIMDSGNYNNNSNTPPNYSAYDRYTLGWLTPTILELPEEVVLQELGASNAARVITANGILPTPTTTQWAYYLENRQKTGWDKYLPGHGLLITKVQYNADVWRRNEINAGTTMFVDIMEADGESSKSGDGGDTYPGNQNVTSFTPFSQYPITRIAEIDSVITFLFRETEVCQNISVLFIGEKCTETNGAICIESGSTYTSTIMPNAKYQLTEDDFLITMNGVDLLNGIDFTYTDSILTIPNVTGGLEILAIATKIPVETVPCSNYAFTFTKPTDFSASTWGAYTWDKTKPSFTGYIPQKGIQLGSATIPAKSVIMKTENTAQCCISKISVTASKATAGDAKLAVFIDDTQIGETIDITSDVTNYEFSVNPVSAGTVEIRMTNTSQAMFLKSIAIEHCNTDIAEVQSNMGISTIPIANGLRLQNIPQNAEIKAFNTIGQMQTNVISASETCDINLPKGLYLIQVTTKGKTTALKAIVR